jgi:stage IV sporulation protein FB
VFLSQPSPTAFDIRFRLFGTPIRVHPMFWLFGAFFGYMYLESIRAGRPFEDVSLGYIALWLVWMFLSILVHEFGHVAMARVSGRRGQIILHSLGGLATWDTPAAHRWQRMAIPAAGPAAGFMLFGLLILIRDQVLPHFQGFILRNPAVAPVIVDSLAMLAFMNIVWNLMNLIPIWPLDGGQIALEGFSGLFPNNGYRLAFGFSALLSGGGAIYSLLVWSGTKLPYPQIHPGFTGLFLGLMAFQNIQILMQAERERRIS